MKKDDLRFYAASNLRTPRIVRSILLVCLALAGTSALAAEEAPESRFVAMSPAEVRAYEADVLRRVADLALVCPLKGIQETLDANPGQMIYVPPGDCEISQQLRLTHDRSGLFGPGRIIQTKP